MVNIFLLALLFKQMQALFRIGKGEPPPIPDSLSKDARDFIVQCLQVNPNNRPSAVQLLHHPFVRRPPPTPSGSASSFIGRRNWEFLSIKTLAAKVTGKTYKLSLFLFVFQIFMLPLKPSLKKKIKKCNINVFKQKNADINNAIVLQVTFVYGVCDFHELFNRRYFKNHKSRLNLKGWYMFDMCVLTVKTWSELTLTKI